MFFEIRRVFCVSVRVLILLSINAEMAREFAQVLRRVWVSDERKLRLFNLSKLLRL